LCRNARWSENRIVWFSEAYGNEKAKWIKILQPAKPAKLANRLNRHQSHRITISQQALILIDHHSTGVI
jgi:hypothetical protein